MRLPLLVKHSHHRLLASRQERRRLLAASWKFVCQCRVCGLEGEQRRRNEEVRERLRGYRARARRSIHWT